MSTEETGDLEGLGPLPESTRNAALERMSFKALDAVLPCDGFVLRDERTEDAGIDASIEILAGGKSTGLRADVQLKATACGELNRDGSLSLVVTTYNFNYLLNARCPVYVVYIEPRRELRYLWARDALRTLLVENPTWDSQKTITLRITDTLDDAELPKLRKRIVDEARLHRNVGDLLAHASLAEPVRIVIDPATMQTTDSRTAEVNLRRHGITMVSCGYASVVVDQAQLIPAERRQAARVQLVLAYARWALGRYLAAIASLQEAMLDRDSLDRDDRLFARLLRDACDYSAGLIDTSEYERRQKAWDDAPHSAYALAHRLNVAYRNWAAHDDKPVREAKLREVAAEIFAFEGASPALRIQARLYLLYVEGGQVGQDVMVELLDRRIRTALRIDPIRPRVAAMLAARASEWESRARDILGEAEETKSPLVIAEAEETYAVMKTAGLMALRVATYRSDRPAAVPDSEIDLAMKAAERALALYVRAGNTDGECRTKLLLADQFTLRGHLSAAHNLAVDVRFKAEALGYAAHVARADEHLSGSPWYSAFERLIDSIVDSDEDCRWAEMSDEETRVYAADLLTQLGLPADRLPMLERASLAGREEARARLSWCRHLELVEDLTHTERPETTYAEDPPRDAQCGRFAVRSEYRDPDWLSVLDRFKRERCGMCSERSPKSRRP